VGVGKAFYGKFQETGLDVMRRSRRQRGIIGVRTRLTKTGAVLVSARRGYLKRPPGSERPFHLPAHPFLRPAASSLRDRIVAGIQKAVSEGVGA
jgi:hypothetical protein